MSDSYTSTHSDSIASLTARPEKFRPRDPLYVVHTSTIPLASTLDSQRLLSRGASVTPPLNHEVDSTLLDSRAVCCRKRSCMFADQPGQDRLEHVMGNCPCHDITASDGEPLRPLCALMYFRAIGREQSDLTDSTKYVDPSRITFCFNSTGIFDGSYGGRMREQLGGITGWQNIKNLPIMITALSQLYWFRRYEKRTNGAIQKVLEASKAKGLPFEKVKRAVEQTIHTLNSLLIKKLLAFGAECPNYITLANQTARGFITLVQEYLLPTAYTNGKPVLPDTPFYNDVKGFSQWCKERFLRPTFSGRYEVFSYKPQSDIFWGFFASEMNQLQFIVDEEVGLNNDYTNSLAFIARMTTLAQTRATGYLPPALADVKRSQFREKISRPVEKLSTEYRILIRSALKERLEETVPRNALQADKPPGGISEDRELHDRLYRHISLPVYGTASVDTRVAEGGKMEDARQLLSLARKNSWKIPRRDLETFEIKEFLQISPDIEDDLEDLSRFLFWISVQLFINHWVDKGEWDREDYHEFLDSGKPWAYPNLMGARIVHISEPGKERNLTASSSPMAWMLTPGAKLLQAVLGEAPSHRAGLLSAMHDWRHQKRISGESDESGFMYGPDGKLRPEIINWFLDYTESTDNILKIVGLDALQVLMLHVRFPHKYGRLICKTVVEPQPVLESLVFHPGQDKTEYIAVKWRGSINEGYMMGNPVTKPILHMMHDIVHTIARVYLQSREFNFSPSTTPYRPIRRECVRRSVASCHRNQAV